MIINIVLSFWGTYFAILKRLRISMSHFERESLILKAGSSQVLLLLRDCWLLLLHIFATANPVLLLRKLTTPAYVQFCKSFLQLSKFKASYCTEPNHTVQPLVD